MKTSWGFGGAMALAVIAAGGAWASASRVQEPSPEVLASLPDGEGEALVATLCTQCHAIGMVTSQSHTREEWDEVIVRMADQGFWASEQDTAVIANYLAEHFGPEAA